MRDSHIQVIFESFGGSDSSPKFDNIGHNIQNYQASVKKKRIFNHKMFKLTLDKYVVQNKDTLMTKHVKVWI